MLTPCTSTVHAVIRKSEKTYKKLHCVGFPFMSGKPAGRGTSLGMSSSFTPKNLFSQSGVFCLPLLVIPGMSCTTECSISCLTLRSAQGPVDTGACGSMRNILPNRMCHSSKAQKTSSKCHNPMLTVHPTRRCLAHMPGVKHVHHVIHKAGDALLCNSPASHHNHQSLSLLACNSTCFAGQPCSCIRVTRQ